VKRIMLFLLLALQLCSVLVSAQTPSQTTGNYYGRFDFLSAYRGRVITVNDTAFIMFYMKWDSIGTPTMPAAESTAYIFYGGQGRFDILYPDGTKHNLDSAGSAQVIVNMWGDGSDGDATISGGTTTLTRDMNYDDLTISSTGFLNTAGFRVKALDSIIIQGAIVDTGITGNNGANGTNGGDGVGGNPGNGGAALTCFVDGYLARLNPSASTILGSGGQGGSNGATGQTQTNGLVSRMQGVSGGTGGHGGARLPSDPVVGAGGAAGSFTVAAAGAGDMQNMISMYLWRGFTSTAILFPRYVGFSGGGGGGSGGDSTSGANIGKGGGGGGGGSGQPGGNIWLAAPHIVGSGFIRVDGGKGGNGGNGGDAYNLELGGGGGGEGGGGGGGSAGIINLFYHFKDGALTISATGGVGGTKGTPGTSFGNFSQPANDGANGTNGNTGIINYWSF